MTLTDDVLEPVRIAAQAASDKMGHNIVAFDVSEQLSITDVFLIASAGNERQVGAIVDGVEEALLKVGRKPVRREGDRENRWVLLDYGGVVVHIQRDTEREFYGLDRLYRDCPLIEVEGIDPPDRPGTWTEDDVDTRQVASIDEIPLAAEEPRELDEEY